MARKSGQRRRRATDSNTAPFSECIDNYHAALKEEFEKLRRESIGCQWGTTPLAATDLQPKWEENSSEFPDVEDDHIAVLGYRSSGLNEFGGFSIYAEAYIVVVLLPSYRLERGESQEQEPQTVTALISSLDRFLKLDGEARKTKPSLEQCQLINEEIEKTPIIEECKGLVGHDKIVKRSSIYGDRVRGLRMRLTELMVFDGKVTCSEEDLVTLLNSASNIGYRTAMIEHWPTAEEEARLLALEKRDRKGKPNPGARNLSAINLKRYVRKVIEDLERELGKKPSKKELEHFLRRRCEDEGRKSAPEIWLGTKKTAKGGSDAIRHRRDPSGQERAAVTFTTILNNWLKAYPKEF